MQHRVGNARIGLTAEIVASFVSRNAVPPADVPSLIVGVHAALVSLTVPAPVPRIVPRPAVPVRRSVTDEFIVSLETGTRFRSMRRHLASLGMTPEQYREKWDLPGDYPMVAPAYARRRSELAKAMGFGKAKPKRARLT